VKAHMGSRGTAAVILIIGTRWRWAVIFMPQPLHLTERTRVHSVGGWVGPRASLHVLKKREISCLFWDCSPRSSSQ